MNESLKKTLDNIEQFEFKSSEADIEMLIKYVLVLKARCNTMEEFIINFLSYSDKNKYDAARSEFERILSSDLADVFSNFLSEKGRLKL